MDPTPEAFQLWQSLQARWQFQWCLIRLRRFRVFLHGQPISILGIYFPRSEWALVSQDGVSALYLRRSPEFADTIKHYEIRNTYPDVDSTPKMDVRWKELFEGGLSGYTY